MLGLLPTCNAGNCARAQAWEGGGADGEDHSKARWSWFLTALSIQLLSGAMTGGLYVHTPPSPQLDPQLDPQKRMCLRSSWFSYRLANGEMEERVGSIAYPLSMIVGVFGMGELRCILLFCGIINYRVIIIFAA